MPIHRLNHAVLYVRNVARSVEFYTEVLGFRLLDTGGPLRGAAFLQAPGSSNDHDIGLFEIGEGAGPTTAGQDQVGLYHLAWEVDTLEDLEELTSRLSARGALVGASDHSTTKSLYAKDPDGIEFEVAWVVPAALLTEADLAGRAGIRPLDLGAAKERFGATTPGGGGVSRS